MTGRKGNRRKHSQKVCPRNSGKAACAAAEIIASNEDLLTQILVHLPAKPLFKFKTVSKFWFTLISSPHISMLWKPKPPSAFIVKESYRHKYLFIPLNNVHRPRANYKSPTLLKQDMITLLHACSGLVLCRKDRSPSSREGSTYFVCNPLTSRRTILPMPQQQFNHLYIVADLVSNNNNKARYFKVISVRKDSIRMVDFEVYSSENGCWRLCPHTTDDTRRVDIIFGHGIVWNSKLYWPSLISDVSPFFDAAKECFGSIPMPPVETNYRRINLFGASNDCLYLIDSGLCNALVVFEMKKDCSSWCRKHVVSYGDVRASLKLSHHNMKVLGFVCGETEKDCALLLLYSYTSYKKYKNGEKLDRAVSVNVNRYDGTRLKWNLVSERNGRKSGLWVDSKFVQQFIENPFWDELLDEHF